MPCAEATRQDGRPGRQLRPRTSGSFSAIKAEVEEWGAGGGHASSDGGCARVPSRLCDASSEMPQTYAGGRPYSAALHSCMLHYSKSPSEHLGSCLLRLDDL